MPVKLKRTSWYIVDLDTMVVAVDRSYDRLWDAISDEKKRKRFKRFTAFTGAHLEKMAGRPWIIPLTVDEAEDLWFDHPKVRWDMTTVYFLKPCPFCGNSALTFYRHEWSKHSVFCSVCGALGPQADNKEDAQEAWNRRIAMDVDL